MRLRATALGRAASVTGDWTFMLAREGIVMNHTKLLRLDREDGTRVRRRGGRDGRKPSVVDHFTRKCLVLVVDTSLSGTRVARKPDRIIALGGKPLVLDQVRDQR